MHLMGQCFLAKREIPSLLSIIKHVQSEKFNVKYLDLMRNPILLALQRYQLTMAILQIAGLKVHLGESSHAKQTLFSSLTSDSNTKCLVR